MKKTRLPYLGVGVDVSEGLSKYAYRMGGDYSSL